MQTLTHQNLLIEGMVRIHRVTDVRIEVTKNEHAKLFIRGIAMDDDELGDITDQLLSPTLGSKFTLYRYEEDKKTPIFSGLIENVNLVEDKGIDYFEIEVISATILFDRKKRKRSFQNVSMTYEQLALQIVSEYDAGATICTVGVGKAIGTPMLQYNETDWEFLKRLSSHFDSPIYPEYTHCMPRVWFGFPNQMSIVDISQHNYIYGQDQSYFDIINNDNDMDFRYVETETYDNFEIGSGTNFKGRHYNLYQKCGIIL